MLNKVLDPVDTLYSKYSKSVSNYFLTFLLKTSVNTIQFNKVVSSLNSLNEKKIKIHQMHKISHT